MHATTTADLGFVHRFVPGTEARLPPLLLLHGTGGDENDLIGLGRMLLPGAALLSPRGQVLEGTMPRFFRRLSEGVFDEADLRARTADLARFIAEARARYGLPAPIAVGFSNGANIAAALLTLEPEALAGAVLFRAMVPFRDEGPKDLAGKPILMVSGSRDPIIPAANADHLARLFDSAGAALDYTVLPTGHGLTQDDVAFAQDWLARRA